MKRILLVEDDNDLRQTMSDLLSRKYTVVEAKDGHDAQLLFSSQAFDLIISDAQMPLMNGVDFLRWTQERRPTPFILITGYSELLDAPTTFSLAVDSVIVKPFMVSDLMGAVKDVFNQPKVA